MFDFSWSVVWSVVIGMFFYVLFAGLIGAFVGLVLEPVSIKNALQGGGMNPWRRADMG